MTTMIKRPAVIEANRDAKGLGDTINVLAGLGQVRPVVIRLEDGRVLPANSCWAATDWLKLNGYYGPSAPSLGSYSVEYA